MNVNIQTVHFYADSKLVDYIEKKMIKLPQFHEQITKVDVYLKLDNVVHSIKDKVTEIKVPNTMGLETILNQNSNTN